MGLTTGPQATEGNRAGQGTGELVSKPRPGSYTAAAAGEQRGPQALGHRSGGYLGPPTWGPPWPALHPGGGKIGKVVEPLTVEGRQSVWKGKGSSLRGTWKAQVNEMGQSTLAAQVQRPIPVSTRYPGQLPAGNQGQDHRISQHLQPDSLVPSCAPSSSSR